MQNYKSFNLVEIIIAMGIIVVALTTILGLYSTGIKISKDSSMKAYANVIIENIVGTYDTNPNVYDDIINSSNQLQNPTTSPNGYYEPANNTDGDIIFHSDSNKNESDIKNAETVNLETDPISGSDSSINIYRSTDCPNIFNIKFKSTVSSQEIVDFSVIARIWIEPINAGATTLQTSDPNSTSISFDRLLKVEISWPPHETYKNRLLQGNVIYFEKDL